MIKRIFVVLILMCLMLSGCDTTEDGGTKVYDALIGDFYMDGGIRKLDTSVIIGFGELGSLDSIVFEIYDSSEKVANAVMEGENLERRLAGAEEKFILRCAFYNLEKETDDGEFVRSKCNLSGRSITKLRVLCERAGITYTTTYIKEK